MKYCCYCGRTGYSAAFHHDLGCPLATMPHVYEQDGLLGDNTTRFDDYPWKDFDTDLALDELDGIDYELSEG